MRLLIPLAGLPSGLPSGLPPGLPPGLLPAVYKIVQFVDLALELLKSSKDNYKSSRGLTKENKNLEAVCAYFRDFSRNLISPSANQLSVDGGLSHGSEPLQKLARDCAK